MSFENRSVKFNLLYLQENTSFKRSHVTRPSQALSGLSVNLSQPVASPTVAPGKSSPTKQQTRYDQYIHVSKV